MKLHVENFAKIKEADIEINGITVIAGENGTGKSTISRIMYCIFETFFEYDIKLLKMKNRTLCRRLERYMILSDDEDEMLMNRSHKIKSIREIVTNLIEESNSNMSFEEFKELFMRTIAKYNLKIYDYNDFLNYSYKILSMDKQQEIENFLFKNLLNEFSSQIDSLYNNNDFNVDLQIKDNHINFKSEENREYYNLIDYTSLNKEIVYYDNPQSIEKINKTLYKMDNFTFLPHENKIISLLEDDRINSNIYEDIVNKNTILSLQNEIKEILNGDFIKEDNEIKFKFNDITQNVDLHNLSSGLKGMAVLLRLIENGKLEEKGTIVLDEPEIHLHPKWQLKYAEMLVLLQKSLNLHILISSHSPYFIDAIEVYSATHKIADKCKYYLADLNEENTAFFEDVTINTEKIYKKLADPLQELADMKAALKENG